MSGLPSHCVRYYSYVQLAVLCYILQVVIGDQYSYVHNTLYIIDILVCMTCISYFEMYLKCNVAHIQSNPLILVASTGSIVLDIISYRIYIIKDSLLRISHASIWHYNFDLTGARHFLVTNILSCSLCTKIPIFISLWELRNRYKISAAGRNINSHILYQSEKVEK